MTQRTILDQIVSLHQKKSREEIEKLSHNLVYTGQWVEACAQAITQPGLALFNRESSLAKANPFVENSPMSWALGLCKGLVTYDKEQLTKLRKKRYGEIAEAIAWCAVLAYNLYIDGDSVSIGQIIHIAERFHSSWWCPLFNKSISPDTTHPHRWLEYGSPDRFTVALQELSLIRPDLPLAPFSDLVRYFLPSSRHQSQEEWTRQVEIRIPLESPERNTGIIATLRLELRSIGTGRFYPNPISIPFLEGDDYFLEACKNAWNYAESFLQPDVDIRWSLSLDSEGFSNNEPSEYDCFIQGNSAGAAFAVGLCVLGRQVGTQIHPMRVITGSVDYRGAIHQVDGYQAKLDATARAGATLLVYPAIDDHKISPKYRDRLKLQKVETVNEALREMVAGHPAPMPLLTAIITSDEYSVTHTPLWSTEEETSFASDVYLVDRQLEHQKCNQQLAMRQHLCLTGRQSSGKTSLARVLCAKHSTSYEHILWVDVVCISSIRHLLQILAEFLSWHGNPNLENQLSKDFSDEYGMKLKSLMSKAISWIHPTKNPFVLVFDHVDSVESESDLATFFKSLVSHSPKTSYIIFTSQSQPNWLDTNAEVCLPEQVSRNEARTMLMVHASNLTDAQIDRVLQASGGNIRALVQAARGIVNRKINPDTVTSSDIAWLNEGLLRDEDTSLTPTERAVLFAIAVLEDVADKTAIYDAIAGMLGHNSLDNDLVRLTKRRYITRTQTRISNFGRTSSIETCYHQVSPVEHSFYYNHEQLGATARRELHRRAAHYYQKTGNIALAALHFDRAGDYSTAINIITAPLRPNDSVNRSITWGSIHSAFWEIIHRGEEKLITQLLELYKEGSGTEGSYRKSFLREDQIIALYLTLGQLYLQKGDLAEARRSFEYTNRYLQHMEQSSERQNKLAFTSYLLAESWEHENPKQALDYIEQCLKFADNLASTVIADLYYKRASILLAQSEYTDSIEAVSIGMKYDNNDLSRQHQRAGAFLKLGSAYSYLSNHKEAIENSNNALLLYETIGDDWGCIGALHNLGISYEELGYWREAQEYYTQALSIAERLGILEDQIALHLSQGILLSKQGQFEARDEIQKAIELALQYDTGFEEYLVGAQASLATLLVRLEEWDSAQIILEEAYQKAIAIDIGSQQLVEILVGFCMVTLHHGQLPESYNYATQALTLALAQKNESRHELGVAYRAYGKILAAQKLLDEAKEQFALSLEILSDEPYEQGLTLLQLGELAEQQGEIVQAYREYQKARKYFDQLGAIADLALVDRLLSNLSPF